MKQLSDEELQDAIYEIAECNVQDTETGEMMYAIPPQKIVDLINTQKRLYAESVRQEAEVSGQLAAVNHLDDKIFYLEVSPRGEFVKRVINKYRDELSKEYAEFRAEQRARIK